MRVPTCEDRRRVAVVLRRYGRLIDGVEESVSEHATRVYFALSAILCDPRLDAGHGVFEAMANLIEPNVPMDDNEALRQIVRDLQKERDEALRLARENGGRDGRP